MQPCYPVVETLEQAFYASCSSVEVTNKRILIALDVSGEMTVPLNAVPTVNARQAATLMAMVTARVREREREERERERESDKFFIFEGNEETNEWVFFLHSALAQSGNKLHATYACDSNI